MEWLENPALMPFFLGFYLAHVLHIVFDRKDQP